MPCTQLSRSQLVEGDSLRVFYKTLLTARFIKSIAKRLQCDSMLHAGSEWNDFLIFSRV